MRKKPIKSEEELKSERKNLLIKIINFDKVNCDWSLYENLLDDLRVLQKR